MKLLYILLSVCSLQAMGQKTKDHINIIGMIDGDHTEKLSMVTIRLDAKPAYKKVYLEDHGDFIQVSIPNSIVSKPGSFIDLKGPFIHKVAAFQIGEHESMVRFFLKEKAKAILSGAEIEILDSRIVLTLDHQTVESKIKALAKVAPASKTQEITSEERKEKKPAKLKKQPLPLAAQQRHGFSSASMQNIALALAVILILFFGISASIKIYRNRRYIANNPEGVKMKAVGHLSLAPKQKLSLVQIGGENILLSVSPDQVAFLTKIEQNKNTQTLQTMTADDYQKRSLAMQSQVKKAAEAKKIAKNSGKKSNEVRKKTLIKTQAEQPKVKKEPRKAHTNQKIQSPDTTNKHQKINYKIDDEGISDQIEHEQSLDDGINDVTQLIREKLKSLPKL